MARERADNLALRRRTHHPPSSCLALDEPRSSTVSRTRTPRSRRKSAARQATLVRRPLCLLPLHLRALVGRLTLLFASWSRPDLRPKRPRSFSGRATARTRTSSRPASSSTPCEALPFLLMVPKRAQSPSDPFDLSCAISRAPPRYQLPPPKTHRLSGSTPWDSKDPWDLVQETSRMQTVNFERRRFDGVSEEGAGSFLSCGRGHCETEVRREH
jgi:hypothetical protein